jgi:hypothetical protein
MECEKSVRKRESWWQALKPLQMALNSYKSLIYGQNKRILAGKPGKGRETMNLSVNRKEPIKEV